MFIVMKELALAFSCRRLQHISVFMLEVATICNILILSLFQGVKEVTAYFPFYGPDSGKQENAWCVIQDC